MKKWICSVCGHVHEGVAPPELCPVCKVTSSHFRLPGEEPVIHVDDPEVAKLRKVIEGLIFSMSGIPNLDDRDAMAQQSGEALKYLYATFEIMVAGDKQSGFNDGLVRRLQLINNFLTWLGSSHVEMDGVSIKWQRNLPSEGTVIVDNVVKVTNIVSRKTQLEQLQKAGIVDSVPEELARLEEERSEIESDLTDSEGIDAAYGQQTV